MVEDNFKRATRTRIITDQEATLCEEECVELEIELGIPPTPEQIEERFKQKVEALVAEAVADYCHGNEFESDLDQAIDGILCLDIAPNDYGLLQRQGILKVLGYDLIQRHNLKHRPGTVTLYYRNGGDWNPQDNLLNMLKYALDHTRP